MLSKLRTVSRRGINLSDSEFEDGPDAQVEMPHDYVILTKSIILASRPK